MTIKKQLCKEVKLVIATTLYQLRNDSHYARSDWSKTYFL